MIRIILFLSTCSTIFTSSYCQNGMEVLHKIAQRYAPGTSIAVNITYLYFGDQQNKEAETSLQGKLVQNSEGAYYKIDQIEIIAQAGKSLTVDHANKTIGLVNYQNPGQVDPVFNPALLDSMAKSGKILLKALAPTGGLSGLLIEQSIGGMYKTEMWYDPDSYLLKKVMLYYNEYEGFGQRVLKNRKMELRYTDYKSAGIVLPKKMADFVTILAKGYEVKLAWKNYKRLN